ncbi:hypothetical protein C7447_11012 [Tenacibaculum adriaticum]|uniref:Thioredoxin-like protein n=1 Tax=Tenacibaculum adriaticum TaxID=413713 RepID=A0A5S5DJB9_9FLAO|nr:hypothetical protein [Tenacibaculum adriaticum]TYP96053.1 hypothetical protein C7447_11012 [Tenacibaculum adriaticum]
MNKYLIPFLSILLIGCKGSKEDKTAYFGGKIINPKSDFVVLYNNDDVLDSIKLTEENTFTGKLEAIKAGLYYFKHGPEHQFVYLEPKDSLLLRLNTWDFDESLVFSGSHADRNNILIETFLQNEIDHRKFYKYYSLSAEKFKAKIDSTKTKKLKILEEYKMANEDASDDFLNILDIALTYPLYTKLENFVIDNSLKKSPEVLNNDFLTHRKIIDINKDSLMFFTPYRDYVYANLYSEVYQKKIKKDSDEFTISLLRDIDSKIHSPQLKNKILRRETIRHFYNKSSCQINKEAFNTFLSLSSNNEDKEIISKLLEDVKLVKSKHKIPSFTVMGANGSMEAIEKLIKGKKTVIYFRNKIHSSDDWVASRINYLINKNPDTQFLVININEEKNEFVKQLDIKHQYYLNQGSKAHSFLTSKFPRVILVNNKGIVENAFGALSSDKIEKQITDL